MVFYLAAAFSPPLRAQSSIKPTDVPSNILQQYGNDVLVGQTPAPLSPVVQRLGKWHLILLHFPIALTLVAALAELIFLWRHKPDFRTTSRFLNTLAALSAVVTVATGWFAAQTVSAAGKPLPILPLHRNLGFAVCALLAINVFLMEMGFLRGPKGDWIYRFSLLAACGLVAWTGYEGGLMVFGDGN